MGGARPGLRRRRAGERRRGAERAMLAVKVKVEKPDLEMASARSRLDAVLQGLLERSEGEREPLEEEAGKAPGDAHSKDASPTAPGKRPSGRFSHHRRKKRREADEGLPDAPQQRHSTYVIKLFDRSVELGQFPEGTPLYPVCRAWMRNCPTARGGARTPPHPPPVITATPRPPRPRGTRAPGPPPGRARTFTSCPPPPPRGPPASPRPWGPRRGRPPPDQPPDPAPSLPALIYKHMERWKRVRQRWKEAAQRQQQRYGASLRLLRRIYERQ